MYHHNSSLNAGLLHVLWTFWDLRFSH